MIYTDLAADTHADTIIVTKYSNVYIRYKIKKQRYFLWQKHISLDFQMKSTRKQTR